MAFKIQGTVAVLPAASKADANVVGTVELHLIVAAIEFGSSDCQFVLGRAHAKRAIAFGFCAFVFAVVAVVAAALVVHLTSWVYSAPRLALSPLMRVRLLSYFCPQKIGATTPANEG